MNLKALVTELGGEGEMAFEGKFPPQHNSVSHNTDANCFLCGQKWPDKCQPHNALSTNSYATLKPTSFLISV